MKIQLDTNSKTIKIEESINLGELTEMLEKLLPNNEWKNFKIESVTVINDWCSPIIVNPGAPSWPYTPSWPSWPWITYGGTGKYNSPQYSLNSGIYNVEVDKAVPV